MLFPFGSPNTLGVGALCYVSFAMIAPHATFGEMLPTMDTDIEQAALIMAEKKIGCLPVLEGEDLIGMLTETDVLRFVAGMGPELD